MAYGRTDWTLAIWRTLAREKRELADELAADGIIAWDAINATRYYEAKIKAALG